MVGLIFLCRKNILSKFSLNMQQTFIRMLHKIYKNHIINRLLFYPTDKSVVFLTTGSVNGSIAVRLQLIMSLPCQPWIVKLHSSILILFIFSLTTSFMHSKIKFHFIWWWLRPLAHIGSLCWPRVSSGYSVQ